VTLFLASIGVLFGSIYWIGVWRPMQTVAERVEREADRLAAIDAKDGHAALIGALAQRQHRPDPEMAFHALIAPDGRALSANLPSWPRSPVSGWARLEADAYRDGDEQDHEALVVERRLADGTRLIVGRDVEILDDREELFAGSSLWIAAVSAALAIGGGIAMSHAITRRLDAVIRTARRVIDGELGERIPLRGTGDDFDHLAETLNFMLSRIEELVESVRRVSDNVAHELRTPLARLHADLDELLSASDDTERKQLIEQAIDEAVRLRSVFDALLRIARIESGRHMAGIRTLDLAMLLRDAVEFHMPEAEAQGQTLTSDFPDGMNLQADPDLLFQAISNLLDNAIKYGKPGGHVHVSAEQEAGQTRIRIVDDGPGIASEHQPHVTERFYRTPEAAAKPGTGLGLSLVSAVVAFHHGVLELDDAAPGTRITLIL
jgi:signal transduction histidine kinase